MGQDAIRNLVGNRDAIRRIMEMDSNGTMDRIASNARKNGSLTYEDGGVSYTHTQKNGGGDPLAIDGSISRNHKGMPKEILESFIKNPGKEASTSVLGNIEMGDFAKKTQNGRITESTASAQPMAQTGSVIDYSLLKTIINEAVQENVKKYMSALAKKLISEGVGHSDGIQAIKLGKRLSVITENGDIYTSDLKKVGNAKRKIEG